MIPEQKGHTAIRPDNVMNQAPLLSPEARLQAILDGTRAGTWEWNLDTGEVLVNHRWAEMLGYEPD